LLTGTTGPVAGGSHAPLKRKEMRKQKISADLLDHRSVFAASWLTWTPTHVLPLTHLGAGQFFRRRGGTFASTPLIGAQRCFGKLFCGRIHQSVTVALVHRAQANFYLGPF